MVTTFIHQAQDTLPVAVVTVEAGGKVLEAETDIGLGDVTGRHFPQQSSDQFSVLDRFPFFHPGKVLLIFDLELFQLVFEFGEKFFMIVSIIHGSPQLSPLLYLKGLILQRDMRFSLFTVMFCCLDDAFPIRDNEQLFQSFSRG